MTARKKLDPRVAQAHPSSVGFLLMDASFNPVYVNTEAVRVLTYPQLPTEITALDRYLSEKVRLLFPESEPSHTAEITSGRRQYFCRVLPVASRSEDPSHATAVLFERSAERSIDIAQAAAEFQLSSREKETVAHLSKGLTTKEIARRMDISPYTVKTYVRLVMIKMGVATRSGVVGKLVCNSAERH
jgi:DNA-binding CsgD family transcriptional regulator